MYMHSDLEVDWLCVCVCLGLGPMQLPFPLHDQQLVLQVTPAAAGYACVHR